VKLLNVFYRFRFNLLKVGLFTPKIWQQSIRFRGKFNTRQPKPRHDIGRYLEELTRPVIVRQIPDAAIQSEKDRQYFEKRFKTTTDTVSFKYLSNLIEVNYL
jgi:hypothetical protein